MSLPGYVPGLPKVSTRVNAVHRIVFRQGDWLSELSSGKIIDGANSRDSGNTGDLDVLRAGLLMGKITTGGKYAPSILGVLTGAYTSGGTTLTVSAAQAVEIARRVGTSGTGTLNAIGPPSAGGTVATTAITFSAVNTGTGDITVTSLGVNKIAGTFITAADGTESPRTMIPDGYGVKVTDVDGSTNLSVPFALFPIAGVITATQLLPVWPSDTSLQNWVRDRLNDFGKFVLDYGY